MRVALDATYSIGRHLSGVGVYSNELLQGLARERPDLRFQFCYRPHRFFKSLGQHLPANASRFLLHDRYRVPSRADLFHGLNQRLPDRHMRRRVVTFHDLFVFTHEFSTPGFRDRFQSISRSAAERADLIIAVSQFTADQLTGILNVDPARIRVVHHGVQPEYFATSPALPREKVVLHVGAIQSRKGIETLIAAFEALPSEWRLVLAGSLGFDADSIVQKIRGSRTAPRILLTGYTSQVELEKWYRKASIFAFPSRGEGFGIPVLEAMAAGVPVICSATSSLPEVAGNAALLVPPDDTVAWREGLLSLAESFSLRNELVAKGTARVSGFTWQRAAQRTLDVYRELL
ncbi:MAG TPA: glycosyltransferase family 1 protein [Bryobacteraceae bacterium]|nr:glycosyltransferase family 1 protein [Bryobacteraceae bacterium]